MWRMWDAELTLNRLVFYIFRDSQQYQKVINGTKNHNLYITFLHILRNQSIVYLGWGVIRLPLCDHEIKKNSFYSMLLLEFAWDTEMSTVLRVIIFGNKFWAFKWPWASIYLFKGDKNGWIELVIFDVRLEETDSKKEALWTIPHLI